MNIMLVMNDKSNRFIVVMLAEESILFTGLLASSGDTTASDGDDVAGVSSNILGVSIEGDSFTMSVIVSTRPSSLIVSTTSSNVVSSSSASIEGRLSLEDTTGEFSQ